LGAPQNNYFENSLFAYLSFDKHELARQLGGWKQHTLKTKNASTKNDRFDHFGATRRQILLTSNEFEIGSVTLTGAIRDAAAGNPCQKLGLRSHGVPQDGSWLFGIDPQRWMGDLKAPESPIPPITDN
jgi:hypothetical protein